MIFYHYPMINLINEAYNSRRIGYLVNFNHLIEIVKEVKPIKIERRNLKVNEIQATYYPGLEYKVGENLDLKG